MAERKGGCWRETWWRWASFCCPDMTDRAGTGRQADTGKGRQYDWIRVTDNVCMLRGRGWFAVSYLMKPQSNVRWEAGRQREEFQGPVHRTGYPNN